MIYIYFPFTKSIHNLTTVCFRCFFCGTTTEQKKNRKIQREFKKVRQVIENLNATQIHNLNKIQKLQKKLKKYNKIDIKLKKFKKEEKLTKTSKNPKIKIIIGEEVRTWRESDIKTECKLSALQSFVTKSFDLKNDIILQYEDEEGDRITLTTSDDLNDALNFAVEQEKKSLKVFVIQNELKQMDILLKEATDKIKYYQLRLSQLSQQSDDEQDYYIHCDNKPIIKLQDNENNNNNILHPIPFKQDELCSMKWISIKDIQKTTESMMELQNELSDGNGMSESETNGNYDGKTEKERKNGMGFICNACDREFTSAWNLKSHFENIHGPKNHKCNECDKRFGARYLLNRHMIIHSGVKPFVCNICSKRFGRNDHLKQHKTHTHRK